MLSSSCIRATQSLCSASFAHAQARAAAAPTAASTALTLPAAAVGSTLYRGRTTAREAACTARASHPRATARQSPLPPASSAWSTS